MLVTIHPSGLRQTKWHEYAVRFVAGGVITVLAGAIAREWGPGVGGLFLAFPAIFPASATLVEKHERQRKQARRMHGEKRGLGAAAADATGAAAGSIPLVAFAALCWWLMPRFGAALVLPGATLAWGLVSVLAWLVRKRGCGVF